MQYAYNNLRQAQKQNYSVIDAPINYQVMNPITHKNFMKKSKFYFMGGSNAKIKNIHKCNHTLNPYFHGQDINNQLSIANYIDESISNNFGNNKISYEHIIKFPKQNLQENPYTFNKLEHLKKNKKYRTQRSIQSYSHILDQTLQKKSQQNYQCIPKFSYHSPTRQKLLIQQVNNCVVQNNLTIKNLETVKKKSVFNAQENTVSKKDFTILQQLVKNNNQRIIKLETKLTQNSQQLKAILSSKSSTFIKLPSLQMSQKIFNLTLNVFVNKNTISTQTQINQYKQIGVSTMKQQKLNNQNQNQKTKLNGVQLRSSQVQATQNSPNIYDHIEDQYLEWYFGKQYQKLKNNKL